MGREKGRSGLWIWWFYMFLKKWFLPLQSSQPCLVHLYHTPSSKTQGSQRRRGQRDCRSQRLMATAEQCYLGTMGQLCTWTHSSWESMHCLCKLKSDRILAWREEVGTTSHPSWRALTIDSYQEWESLLSLSLCSIVVEHTSKSIWVARIGLNGFKIWEHKHGWVCNVTDLRRARRRGLNVIKMQWMKLLKN